MSDSHTVLCQIRQVKRKLVQAVVQDSLRGNDVSQGLDDLTLLSQIARDMTAPRFRAVSSRTEMKIRRLTGARDDLMPEFLAATDSHQRRNIIHKMAELSADIVKVSRNEF